MDLNEVLKNDPDLLKKLKNHIPIIHNTHSITDLQELYNALKEFSPDNRDFCEQLNFFKSALKSYDPRKTSNWLAGLQKIID